MTHTAHQHAGSIRFHINIRIDHDVLEWFKKNGRGYQTLMNNVLRAFVQTRRLGEEMKSR